MPSTNLLIVFIPSFLFGLCMLIMLVKVAKEDPSALGLAVYGGGVYLAICGISAFGIISFIINL